MKKKILYGVLGALALAQLVQITKTNPAVESDFIAQTNAPADVAKMLREACYDCHSNETKFPWYTYINPVGWWVGHHIDEGREHLNFSTWAKYDAKAQAHKLEECAEEVAEGKMPLKSYTWAHGEAKLTDAQKKQLAEWFESQISAEYKGAHDHDHHDH